MVEREQLVASLELIRTNSNKNAFDGLFFMLITTLWLSIQLRPEIVHLDTKTTISTRWRHYHQSRTSIERPTLVINVSKAQSLRTFNKKVDETFLSNLTAIQDFVYLQNLGVAKTRLDDSVSDHEILPTDCNII